MTDMWTPPPPRQDSAAPKRRRRGLAVGTALVGAGVITGTILGASALSSAATTSPSTTSSSTTTSSAASSSTSAAEATEKHGAGLDLSGTVTAVGTSEVTIKTSSGTTVYKVDSNSDIDKNGEATLSSLAVGDAVTFNVDSTSATTIDKLHAGNEALDRPAGAPSSATTGG
jgi:hypothetical protein